MMVIKIILLLMISKNAFSLHCMADNEKQDFDVSRKALSEIKADIQNIRNTLYSDYHQVVNKMYAVLRKRSDSLSKLDQKIQKIDNDFKFVEKTCQNTDDVELDKYNGHCYHYGTDKIDWFTAKKNCKKIGGYLVKIDNKDENKRIHSIIRKTGKNHWIGLADFTEGQFRWTFDQSLATSIPWFPGRGKHDTNRNCVNIGDSSGQWDDRTCSYKLPYICERNLCK
ncbi:unnamed protein product [Mytilus coruscus]|uniref:C-type lectin domain-containing protein n=1 Tax=Mytilus coruscus TaxID=42192 RepID=A0A6J8BK52_MYTCO|nr:unnamed protein product [Mytilus coruscus]